MHKMMKATALMIIITIIMVSGTAMALGLAALDMVSVRMTRAEVIALLGTPDHTDTILGGLQVEVYKVDNADPLVGTGCIYDDEGRLAGQTFIFRGEMSRDASARMQQLGFVVTEVKEDTFRLLGKDDDTGHPLVVHIGHSNGLTVVTTFSKDFYDRRAGK